VRKSLFFPGRAARSLELSFQALAPPAGAIPNASPSRSLGSEGLNNEECMPGITVRSNNRQIIAHSARALSDASRRARAFADAAILAQLSRRLQQLDDLVGKLAFSLREIKGSRERPRN
jgi:hypothetical protein